MDSYALRLANRLLGNENNAAGLEITMRGPEMRFLGDAVIALTGADLMPRINDQEIPLWETVAVRAGDQLAFGGIRSGCRSYLAVAGGIDVPVVLGSRATYIRGGLGGLEGRQLKAGDVLYAGSPRKGVMPGMRVPGGLIPLYGREFCVRVVLGPQDDYFPAESIRAFLSEAYQVTAEADRMGCRLEGAKICHKQGADIISDGISPGSIQVPGHGMPIIMLADRQTTGGYAKIATAISADMSKLAQVKPGDFIRFAKTSVEEAQAILRGLENKLARWDDGRAQKYAVTVDGCLYEVVVRKRTLS
jgi:biotin-dependent carboxylase-like uncharacterized protein